MLKVRPIVQLMQQCILARRILHLNDVLTATPQEAQEEMGGKDPKRVETLEWAKDLFSNNFSFRSERVPLYSTSTKYYGHRSIQRYTLYIMYAHPIIGLISVSRLYLTM